MTQRQTWCELTAGREVVSSSVSHLSIAAKEEQHGQKENRLTVDIRDIEACLPAQLHSFSRQVLEIYLMGHMSTAEFRRWFHMPNSDYLMLGDCIAQKVDPQYVPEAKLPPSITLRPNTL
jgi:hypothetical protein